jgi:hypothetical protein
MHSKLPEGRGIVKFGPTTEGWFPNGISWFICPKYEILKDSNYNSTFTSLLKYITALLGRMI